MNRKMLIINLWLFVYGSYFLHASVGLKKTWKFNNDILNPIHWEGGGESKHCNGFTFPEILGSVGSISQLVTNEVILPLTGELEIQNGGFIQISDTKKCVRVKEIVPKYWLDPENWEFEGNLATPHAERVPCVYDDVSFPRAVAVYYPEVPLSVNSIEIDGIKLTNAQWQIFLQSDYGVEQFQAVIGSSVGIETKTCTLKSGCKCHDSEETSEWVCNHVPEVTQKQCFKPIKPVGFCGDVCGGVIYVDVTPAFSLDNFKARLPKNTQVDVYASKITRGGRPSVQVVFVEKSEYTEQSQKEASDFYNTLQKDLDRFRIKGAVLETSGISLPQGSVSKTVFGIIFGTLAGAICILLTLYVLYVGPLRDYDLRSRMPISKLSFEKGRFRQFDNEGLSTAASMLSLEKSFDNPMYGAVEPSTSHEIVDAVALIEERSQGKKEDLVVIEDVHDTDED